MRKLLLILSLTVFVSGGAQSWTPLSVGNTADVMDISFPSDDTGFASLGNGTIRRTVDGAMTWNNIPVHPSHFGIIDFISGSKGFVLDDSGIVMTTNAGQNWSFVMTNTQVLLWDIYFYDANTGYAAGTAPTYDTFMVYKTTDGGSNWTNCTAIPDGFAGLPVIYFRTPLEGYVTGGIDLHRTTDGGVTWTTVYSEPGQQRIPTICAPDALNAYCATEGSLDIVKSINGGMSWSSTLQVLASPSYDSHFLTGNVGFICGGNGFNAGYIVETINGGSSWGPVYGGVHTMGCMDFPSGTCGYCGGTGGFIMKYGDPMSMPESSQSLVSCYPNPASDFLIVENVVVGSEIIITNFLGQIVLQQTAIDDKMRIDVSRLGEGMYYCEVIMNERRTIESIVIW